MWFLMLTLSSGRQPASAYVDPASTASQQLTLPSSTSVGLNMRGVSKVLDTVVGDLLMKQQVLERLQRAFDVSQSRSEVAACRMTDLKNTNR